MKGIDRVRAAPRHCRAKAIERVGDHAKNLAEVIIYIVKGTDVRHNSVADVESMVR
jgi:phosphate transport system protein